MARPHRIHVRENLRALVSKDAITEASAGAGFVQRSRKLDLLKFVWTLVWGFGVGGDRTFSALHRTYSSCASARIGESSFGDWFRKPEFPVMMQTLVGTVLDRLDDGIEGEEALAGELGQFQDLLIADSSVVRLHSSLQRNFSGTRTNHSPASLKVHLVQKVTGAGLHRIKITEGRQADSKTLKWGPGIQDSLLLLDLGYYHFARFARVEQLGGYFISRAKTGANPTIVESLRVHRGKKVPVEGEKLQDVLPRFQRKVIDLEVRVRFQPRIYRGERHTREQTLRLVGVWNDEDGKYHLYFTNLAPDQLTTEAIAEAYRLRCQVELLFRALKSIHGLGKIRTLSPHAVVGLVYAAILSMLVTRHPTKLVQATLGLVEADTPFERAARTAQHQGVHLLRIVAMPPRSLGRLELDVERVLLDTMPDRNRSRRTLPSSHMNLTDQEAA